MAAWMTVNSMNRAPMIVPAKNVPISCPECAGPCSGLCSRSFAEAEEYRLGRIALLLDHTQLKPDAGRAEILRLCGEARRYRFASVCVNPVWVATAVDAMRETPVLVCTVIGFPLGATTASARRAEAAEVLRLGADELDMVIDIGGLKDGDDVRVRTGIRGVVELAHAAGARVKVILETALLSDEEKVRGCRLSLEAGADYVKTSTGFSSAGATVGDVALMRRTVGDAAGVKASGGIRTYSQLLAMAAAGASRIGASASVQIMQQAAAAALLPR